MITVRGCVGESYMKLQEKHITEKFRPDQYWGPFNCFLTANRLRKTMQIGGVYNSSKVFTKASLGVAFVSVICAP